MTDGHDGATMRRSRVGRIRLAVAAAAGLGAATATILTGSAFADDKETATRDESSPAAVAAHQAALVPGTPCTVTAKACVELESQRAWLLDNGRIVAGPLRISSGGNGQETPVGHSLRVYRKDKDHLSQESRTPNGQPAPMPWSVFFADGGIAFHGGDPNRSSAGCIHVPGANARNWFNYLQIGDQVQVVRASLERAARRSSTSSSRSSESDSPSGHNSDDSEG